jgi:hypothetical protein
MAASSSPHGLRAGLISAAAPLVPEDVIAATTRHRRTETVRGYVRDATAFDHTLAAALDL